MSKVSHNTVFIVNIEAVSYYLVSQDTSLLATKNIFYSVDLYIFLLLAISESM